MRKKTDYYIGLMSGTSIDAIDAVLVTFDKHPFELIATHSEPIPKEIKDQILNLCYPGTNGIERMGHTDVALGRMFAKTCIELLHKASISPEDVAAIGSHGQTIRHQPNDKLPFTIQIGDPNIITAKTNITTVADFRRRDMALGGQAAPLTPAFHEYALRTKEENRWVVNIGGIANVTQLPADSSQPVIGFDSGPGNTLLDAWYRLHKDGWFDVDSQWALTGKANQELFETLFSDIYFKLQAPKSTGREYFSIKWLNSYLKEIEQPITPQDIQATLVQLTAHSIVASIANGNNNGSIYICGGGAKNANLVQQIKDYAHPLHVDLTNALDIDPEWMEAIAFAWLAKQTLENKPGNIPSVTNASSASVLGAIFPRN